MNLYQALKKVGEFFLGFRHHEFLLLVNLLVFIEQRVWHDRKIHLLVLLLIIVIIFIILMMNFQKAEGIDQTVSSNDFLLVMIHHISCKSFKIFPDSLLG